MKAEQASKTELPTDFHPIFNVNNLSNWLESYQQIHHYIEMGGEYLQTIADKRDEAEKYFHDYFECSDEHGLEACQAHPQLIDFATKVQKDNADFAFAVLSHFSDTPNKMTGSALMWIDKFSSRISLVINELSVKDALFLLGHERQIAIEKHRLESFTTKPRFAFDFSPKPAIVKEAPKPKMRMKI